MMNYLENNTVRRLLRIFLALSIAVCVDFFYAKTPEHWVIISALLVMTTLTGSALLQGLIRFAVLFVMVSVGVLLFSDAQLLYAHCYDVTLGAVIGILVNVMVLPDRVGVEFRRAIIPVLKAYRDYVSAIIELILKNDLSNAEKVRNRMDLQLKISDSKHFSQ